MSVSSDGRSNLFSKRMAAFCMTDAAADRLTSPGRGRMCLALSVSGVALAFVIIDIQVIYFVFAIGYKATF